MAHLSELLDDLVIASHILANEGICDAFGHASIRDPENPNQFYISRARSPELVERGDIMKLTLDGNPVDGDDRKPFLERFIHGSLYHQRPDVGAVIHSHSRNVIPFSISQKRLRPVVHSCATIGECVPVWDAQTSFGDTNLLISSKQMGDDFADVMATGRSALMRGHGSTVIGKTLKEAVYTAIYLDVNAQLQFQAMQMGDVSYLTKGEIEKICARLDDAKPGEGYGRAWDYWARRVKSQNV